MPLDKIPYDAILDIVDNKMRVSQGDGMIEGILGPWKKDVKNWIF